MTSAVGIIARPHIPVVDSDSWVMRTTLPFNLVTDYDEVFVDQGRPAYGNGTFLLTGIRFKTGPDAPLAITSTDGGLTWVRTDLSSTPGMPSTDSIMEFCLFGDGIFVGVAQTYGETAAVRFCTSTDGVTWAVHDDGGFTSGSHVYGIAHNGQSGGASLFTAVGYTGGFFSSVSAIATSPDGVTWTQRGDGGFTRHDVFNDPPAVPVYVEHNHQAGGAGMWVAQSRLNICTSPDGITWTERQWGADGWQSSASDGTGTIVALARQGGNTHKVKTSTDGGITWTARTASTSDYWSSIAFGAGLYVAVSENGTVMTSPDGATWTARSAAVGNVWKSVTYAASIGLFVAVSNSGSGNRVMTSPDGITWTSRVSAANNSWRSVCWSASVGLFVAVSDTGTGNRVMTSPDGINWTSRTSAFDSPWVTVTFGAGLFVAITSVDTMTSPDGITWTRHVGVLPVAGSWQQILFAEGLFVVANAYGTGAATSPDGLAWTLVTDVHGGHTVVYDGAQFLVIDFGNAAWSSPDGITWTNIPSNVNRGYGEGVTHNYLSGAAGLFVIPFNAQTPPFDGPGYLTSPDGITWTFRHVTATGTLGNADLCGLVYHADGGYWLGLVNGDGLHNYITSPDGVTWTAGKDEALALYAQNDGSLGYGNGMLIATYYYSEIVFRHGPTVDADVRWIANESNRPPTVDPEQLQGTVISNPTLWHNLQTDQARTTGKRYYETVLDVNDGDNFGFGVGMWASVSNANPGNSANEWQFIPGVTPQKWHSNVGVNYGASAVAGDVIGVMLDIEAGTLSYSKNGVDMGVAFTGVAAVFINDDYVQGFVAWCYSKTLNTKFTTRFKRADMQYIPVGFKTWCEA